MGFNSGFKGLTPIWFTYCV